MGNDVTEGKVFAILGIVFTLIGFLIVLLAKKENKYAMFYAKQGLVLFIVGFIASIASFIVGFIPFFGWIISPLLSLGVFVLWVIGIVYAASGEMKDIPIVGDFAKKLNI